MTQYIGYGGRETCHPEPFAALRLNSAKEPEPFDAANFSDVTTFRLLR